MQLNNWDDFINKLKDGKKTGKSKGVSVPCITNLLYAGAFDGLLEDRFQVKKDRFTVYNELFEEVKSALKSKAGLPSKKKTDTIGLEEVNSDLHLALWRQQVNPLSSFDLIGAHMGQLQMRGYTKDDQPGRLAWRKKDESTGIINFLMPDWQYIFKYLNTPVWTSFTHKDGMARLQFLGIVSESSKLRYADGQKEMIKFKIYIGKEFTDEIVIWPDRETGKIRDYWRETVKPGLIAIFTVKPTYYNGRYGASLLGFDSIGSRNYV